MHEPDPTDYVRPDNTVSRGCIVHDFMVVSIVLGILEMFIYWAWGG